MNKQTFLAGLRKGLSGLPQSDIEERLTFYGEMIDDRMEEGLSEEQAVLAIGPVDEIITQIIADTPFVRIAKERIKPKKRLKAWEIVLLALGSPIWLSLGVAAIAVILALYISVWAVIVSLWAVFVSLAGCAFGGMVAGVLFVCSGTTLPGIAILAAGLVLAGLSIFTFYGCQEVSKVIVKLTKHIAVGIKNGCIKKEEAE